MIGIPRIGLHHDMTLWFYDVMIPERWEETMQAASALFSELIIYVLTVQDFTPKSVSFKSRTQNHDK